MTKAGGPAVRCGLIRRLTRGKGLLQLEVHRRSKVPVDTPYSNTHSGDNKIGSTYSMGILERILLWHNRIRHFGTTMFRRMLPAVTGHAVCKSDAEKVGACASCSKGKYVAAFSKWKLPTEMPTTLECLQGDVCGPVSPASGPFRYYFVLVDAFRRHAEVTLLSTRNMIFPKILAMIIKFRSHYHDHNIKTSRVDNAKEFRSKTFETSKTSKTG